MTLIQTNQSRPPTPQKDPDTQKTSPDTQNTSPDTQNASPYTQNTSPDTPNTYPDIQNTDFSVYVQALFVVVSRPPIDCFLYLFAVQALFRGFNHLGFGL